MELLKIEEYSNALKVFLRPTEDLALLVRDEDFSLF